MRGAIETLEERIAPAVLISADGHRAHYIDTDGDHVSIYVSTGHLSAGNFTLAGAGAGSQLQEIDLTAKAFNKADVVVKVIKSAHGDGLANIGYIDATGIDLSSVVVKGDLGRIDAGSGGGVAIKKLDVASIGRLGTDTQGATASLTSNITGALNALNVAGDIIGAYIKVSDGSNGKIESVNIRGSLIGASGTYSGEITSSGHIGLICIGGDIEGGTGQDSGSISSFSGIHRLQIGGSIIGSSGFANATISSFLTDASIDVIKIAGDVLGGSGIGSSQIVGGVIGQLTIGGSVIGGSGNDTAKVRSLSSINTINIVGSVQGASGDDSGSIDGGHCNRIDIGGSLIGGSGQYSGKIWCGNLHHLAIGHNLVGGSIEGSASLYFSGSIDAGGRIDSIHIGGSIIGGTDLSSGQLINCGNIDGLGGIGHLSVKGSVIGTNSGHGYAPVIISARGPVSGHGWTIGRITVGGRVENVEVLAGYGMDVYEHLQPDNASARVGFVNVSGDWIASNLVAGAQNKNYPNFGDSGDSYIRAGTGNPLAAKIASVIIKGQVFGTPDSTNSSDHFGLVADRIGVVKVGAQTFHPTAGIQAVGETGDVAIDQLI